MSAVEQPYAYSQRELVEPDWTRFPGWSHVTAADWASAQWQRAHCVKTPAQLRAVVGDLLDEGFYADLAADQALLGAETAPGPMVVVPFLAALAILVSGIFYFRRLEKTFADVV